MNTLPADYEERVYAGILGKIIGVYLGRPFEGWPHARIERELGEVWHYVHERLGKPLVVADDDISGTFTFLRALDDHGPSLDLTSEQIGKTWLNYLIENRTVLWWGGFGVSTEHTAYLNLKSGIPAPRSGSIDRNGPIVAEQIGAQIFIDGWAMVCPGDPARAVELATRAARVSHDGEAVCGAQVIAAIEAQAFIERDIHRLLDTALTFIPRASTIAKVIEDICKWRDVDPQDWRTTFHRIERKYGYDKFGGGCHMVPNHALILLALLYADDDFQKALMIAATAGWDTDCNAGNVGCIMGIKNGLVGMSLGADLRTPVADRLFLPTADGARCVTDAVRETYAVVNLARALQGQRPLHPNQGMRFHFSLPGSVQGFQEEDSPESRGLVRLENVLLGRVDEGVAMDERMLALRYGSLGPGRTARVSTATFLPPELLPERGGSYDMVASPTLYPGQTVRARLLAGDGNGRPVTTALYVCVYGKDDALERIESPPHVLAPGENAHFHWDLPDTDGKQIAEVGVSIAGHHAVRGTVYLDWMGWAGVPRTTFGRPANAGKGVAWKRAWVRTVDEMRDRGPEKPFVLVQNADEPGFALIGEQDWTDYTVSTVATPHLAAAFGLVVCSRGLRRYVALLIERGDAGVGRARLVERYDGEETTLESTEYRWDLNRPLPLTITTYRNGLVVAKLGGDGDDACTLTGEFPPELAHGALGLLVRRGHVAFGPVHLEPAPHT